MTTSPGAAVTPSDPGEDWARAIADMTGTAEVADVASEGAGAHPSATGPSATDLSATGPSATDRSAAASRPAAAQGSAAGRRRRIALAAISVATVIVGSFGIWAAVAAHGLRASAANANQAFTDPAATAATDRQVAAAVNTIFSYSYANSARTKAAAQGLLTGAAIRQYNQLFAIVETQAPKEKLIVTTRVTNIGVELLTGARARVLVFANQQDTAAGTGKTSYGGAMFAVTAVNHDGRWRIESIDTFSGPA